MARQFTFSLLFSAALAYALGGAFMKWSRGFTRPGASAAALAFVLAGVAAHSVAMRYLSLGAAYLVVVGLEVAFALVLGRIFFAETYSFLKALGLALIMAGVGVLYVAG